MVICRQFQRLLKPEGIMLITTPNVTSWLSRAMLLLRGRFHPFADEDVSYGHISPITPWCELELIDPRRTGRCQDRSAGTLPPVYVSGFE